ncbi:MAG: phosphoenolpyruvate carboxykinase (GTP) [Candidatus Lokiarchaeota archaeon]|nr:phosphoenolpyruvate carboxykinase (GTP) [Candidatus Harpocratesius repetitus]
MHEYEISPEDQAKLAALNNPKVEKVVKDAIELMKPAKVMVFTDSLEEIQRFRQLAIDYQEEKRLKIDGHTIHYDGYHDQARDKAHTATLLPKGETLSRGLNVIEREQGLKEILSIMDGAMRNKVMVVRFFCLGPTHSRFAIPTLQITDSFYVGHSEDLLYRPGYEQFRQHLIDKNDFFYFWHSAGELDERNCTKNVDKRRIYIDPLEYRVFSVNNQYAGNSLACKKLALRLAIYRANHSDWLAEHMFLSAFYPLDRSRKTYFTGAYPSACGKTSTAMIPGATIVGDDIVYIREGKDGDMRAVNIEQGIFGIIKDVNPKDDPVIYKAITTPKEVIFSNVLTTDEGKVYWTGMGVDEYPTEGWNHAGKWKKGMKDSNGKEIPISHPNARFTVRIDELENIDEKLHDPEGAPVSGILYGGRDSDTTVPIAESLNWEHGVFIGATIESETTSATLGQEGVRKSSPMANMDFIIVPLGKYFKNHLKFGKKLKKCPKVFSTNYFLKDADGKYLNTKLDKKVWLLWAEGRVHGDYDGIETPIGVIPKYDDLRSLFAAVFDGRIYSKEEYNAQFSLKIDRYLAKYDRMEALFKDEPEMPDEFWNELERIRSQLHALKDNKGKSIILPEELQNN